MSSGSSDVTIGYKYYLGLHMALCYPVDELLEFKVADRLAWSGTASTGSITVNSPALFGGEKREGGVSGTVDILDGDSAMPVNSYLDSKISGNIPAFRGVLSLVFRQFYIGMNPYLKPFAFKVRRVDTHTDGTAIWYAAKSDISGALNAAHIVYECLTNSSWGLGYPTATIDDTNFRAIADTLYSESFGLSLIWNQKEKMEDFLLRIMNTVAGMLYVDPTTGLWTMRLIRDDYTPSALPLFDETNTVRVRAFERIALGETVNEYTVEYTDHSTNVDSSVTWQNIGNIQMQGTVVNQTINYPGVPTYALAARIAERDGLARSLPLSKIRVEFNREAWDLAIGDVFRFSNDKLGLSEVVYRVGRVSTGLLEDGAIEVEAIEDIFALPSNTYTAVQPTGWSDPTSAPAPADEETLVEASYWDIQMSQTQADISNFDPDFGFIVTLASRPSGDAYGYDVWSKVGGASYAESGSGIFAPTATLASAASITDTTLTYENDVDIDLAVINGHAYLGDEVVEILTVNESTNQITVNRGILDTVPQPHASGTRLWFSQTFQGYEEIERVDADTVDVKLLPTTSQGTLAIGSASALQITLDNRYQRPYAPGNVKVNGSAYPASAVATIDVTWSHRDRTQQLAYFNTQDEGNIGPETDVTYSINIKDGAMSIVDSATGLTGTSHSYVPGSDDTYTVELWAVRDGLDSYQTHVFSFSYTST